MTWELVYTKHEDYSNWKELTINPLDPNGLSKGYDISTQESEDLAWTGLYNSIQYQQLNTYVKDRITDIVNAEFYNNNDNPGSVSPKGTRPCPN